MNAHAPLPEPVRLPPPHPATLDDDALLRQCVLTRGRSTGPGGQHRNKVETLVELLHEPTGIEAHAGERRSVRENTPAAVCRLRLALGVRARCPVPAGDVRSALWRARCTPAGRIVCSPEHRDYPSLLAEALDMIDACDLDVKKASARLECSSSQLIRLVKDHPPAFVWLNAARAGAGLHALH